VKGRFVPQEIAPQHEDGVDWSGRGRVLVRTSKRRLVWRGGRRYFGGIGRRSYAPAELQVIAFPDAIRAMSAFLSKKIFEGGRLTMGRIEGALPTIREAMLLPDLSMDHIEIGRTFVVENEA
jgi:hypothetical protein